MPPIVSGITQPTFGSLFDSKYIESFYFQLPKARFVSDSDTFAMMYGIPLGSDEDHIEGKEIYELEVSLADFESFLKAFLPGCPSHRHSHVVLSFDEWLSVLKLSSKWLFNDLRDESIRKLGALPMTPIQRVLLARQYSIPAWLIEGYVRILNRMSPTLESPCFISKEDARELGWDVALELSNITLKQFHCALKGRTPLRPDIRSSERLRKELEDINEAAGRFGGIGSHVAHAYHIDFTDADDKLSESSDEDNNEVEETSTRNGRDSVVSQSLPRVDESEETEQSSQHTQDDSNNPATPISEVQGEPANLSEFWESLLRRRNPADHLEGQGEAPNPINSRHVGQRNHSRRTRVEEEGEEPTTPIQPSTTTFTSHRREQEEGVQFPSGRARNPFESDSGDESDNSSGCQTFPWDRNQGSPSSEPSVPASFHRGKNLALPTEPANAVDPWGNIFTASSYERRFIEKNFARTGKWMDSKGNPVKRPWCYGAESE
ncbi:hypothetical protein BKA70DRAFT_796348 [Coprinopsis sp. MPI-PUGE-AT-0042]|nr:hypothetical protein BKA70DRAFT_796348 [Coprinopsis sp. MPI-PUGE-AT-0042]